MREAEEEGKKIAHFHVIIVVLTNDDTTTTGTANCDECTCARRRRRRAGFFHTRARVCECQKQLSHGHSRELHFIRLSILLLDTADDGGRD